MAGLIGAKAPKPPAPPPVMPMADDKAVQEAKKRRTAQVQQRSGRMSTVLTDEKLGG